MSDVPTVYKLYCVRCGAPVTVDLTNEVASTSHPPCGSWPRLVDFYIAEAKLVREGHLRAKLVAG